MSELLYFEPQVGTSGERLVSAQFCRPGWAWGVVKMGALCSCGADFLAYPGQRGWCPGCGSLVLMPVENFRASREEVAAAMRRAKADRQFDGATAAKVRRLLGKALDLLEGSR